MIVVNELVAAKLVEEFGWVEGRDFLVSPPLPEDPLTVVTAQE